MKSAAPAAIAAILFVTACQHRLPEIAVPEVSPAPLVQELDTQRRRLTSVKAVARVETERKGRKRSYESVTIVMDDRGRLRVDGFGPLGESLFALLWDGKAVLLRPPGEPEFLSVGQAGLERALGVALSPADLSAALGGNVIVTPSEGTVRAGCDSGGRCRIHFDDDRGFRRIYASRPAGETAQGVLADGEDLYDGGRLVYRGRFEGRKSVSGYLFPMVISLENPDRELRLVVLYEDVEVNVPVDDALFQGNAR